MAGRNPGQWLHCAHLCSAPGRSGHESRGAGGGAPGSAGPARACRTTVANANCTRARQVDAGCGVLTSATDPNAATTSYEFDTFGRLTATRRPGDTAPGQATATYQYAFGSAPNRVTTVEKDGSPDGGRATVQFYDGLGRLLETKRELADNLSGAGRRGA